MTREPQETKARFTEIDVERINVVEKDGAVKLVISNTERQPDPVLNGKTLTRRGPRLPGLIFYNGEGDECGGLIFGSERTAEGPHAGFHLSFDQFKNDQILVLAYGEQAGQRWYGLEFYDRPDDDMADAIESARALPDGPEKNRKLRELWEQGAFGHPRMFVGRTADGEAMVRLHDSKGRPRIRMQVGADDVPRLEFLNARGEVVYSLPPEDVNDADPPA